MQDYCWDSLASLYTFQETKTLPGLARDCLYKRVSPNSPNFSHEPLLVQAPKFQGFALPMSYRGKILFMVGDKGFEPLAFSV